MVNRQFFILSLLVFFGDPVVYAQTDTQTKVASQAASETLHSHSEWSFLEAGKIPIQSGGRIKPLDSFARESVLFLTGRRSFQGWDPVDLLFSWVTAPGVWEETPFIRIGHKDVRKQILVDEGRKYFSPKELFGNLALMQYAQNLGQKGATVPNPKVSSKADPRQEELNRVVQRLSLFRTIASGEAWSVIPVEGSELGKDSGSRWSTLAAQLDSQGNSIREKFAELVRAYYVGDQDLFERMAIATRKAVEAKMEGFDSRAQRLRDAEILYNRLQPFFWCWVLYLCAALLLSFGSLSPWAMRLGTTLAGLTFVLHSFGFALRCYVAGRPPVTNMYESVIWVSFGVMLFAFILFALDRRQKLLLAVASAVSGFALVSADASPTLLDPGIHPLVPVLRSNYWLTIHVLTITLSYAAFALTLGLANVALFQYLRGMRRFSTPSMFARISKINLVNYRVMAIGVVLLAAGTILGGVWADYSWGRFWGWDPKEVWALIALLTYLALLHARYAGWVGQFGFAAWTVVSFLTVLMAWYGVNFVLGVGLHSYGFASGGQAWVAGFTALNLAYVAFVGFVIFIRKNLVGVKATPRQSDPLKIDQTAALALREKGIRGEVVVEPASEEEWNEVDLPSPDPHSPLAPSEGVLPKRNDASNEMTQ